MYSHGTHVVLGEQGDLQHLGVAQHDLMAGGGDGLAGDAVDLVEGVGAQEAVVCSADEQLQGERLTVHVAVQLAEEQREPGETPTAVAANVSKDPHVLCHDPSSFSGRREGVGVG